MSLINTTLKDVGLSSDPNTDGEIDAKASSCRTTSTDIEHDLQYEDVTAVATPHSFAYHKQYPQRQQQQLQIRQQLRHKSDGPQQDEDAITSDPAIRSTRQKCVSCFFGILYIIAMCGSLIVGVGIMCGTLGNGLNPQAASQVGEELIVIAALLLCLPFAVLIRSCYRKDPTQTIRGFSIVLGMWAAAIAGSFVGIYPNIRLGFDQPWALVFGIPSSLLTCLLLACRLKTLRIQNMLHRFYRTQLAVTCMVVNPMPFGVLLFFAEEQQETVRTAELDIFIGTIFLQFLFLTTSTMTWFNLVGLGLGLFLACLATIIVWPFLLHYIYKKSVSFVHWLVVTHGQQHLLMVRMLVPNFEIINDTKDVISSKQNNIVDTHQIV